MYRGIQFTPEARPLSVGRRPSAAVAAAVNQAITPWTATLLAFLAPFLAYLLTLSPTVYNLDSAEMTTAAYNLGLMRATGYPLYLLLGKLFSLIPVGDVGYRLNLMSAVFGALTIALIYRIALRLAGRGGLALPAALFLGFSYYFWSQAVIAEVYTLHTALMAALILLLLRWREGRAPRLLGLIAWLYGLSFGNHMASVLLAPGIAAFVLMAEGRGLLRWQRLIPLAGAFALGLSVYLYLPLRTLASPAFNYAGHFDASGRFIPTDLTQPAELWAMITGAPFQGEMFAYALAELPQEVGLFIYRLWGNFLSVGLLPGLIGLVALWRRERASGLMLALMFLANAVFYINYRVVDKETMFLPVYLVWALWIAVGLRVLDEWAGEMLKGADGGRRTAVVVGLRALSRLKPLLLMIVLALLINAPRVDVSHDRRARDLAEALLRRVEPNAIILGWWASIPPMQYLQIVEGWRPDVVLINRWLISYPDMLQLIATQGRARPIYFVEFDGSLVKHATIIPANGAYRVWPLGSPHPSVEGREQARRHLQR